MLGEHNRLDRDVGALPHDFRFNAVNWAFDCLSLAREIVFSYCWMHSHADDGATTEDKRLFPVQYYADNCITRINSFRDKAALLVWSYYCAFNPNRRDEVLGFVQVMERLRCPVRFGLSLANCHGFQSELEKLTDQCFVDAARYRHLKTHRIEPKILMHAPTSSDGLSYMFPIVTKEEHSRFRKELGELYPNGDDQQFIEKHCKIGGVLFDRRKVEDEYWEYAKVEEFTRRCTHVCVDVARGLTAILRGRAPLRQRKSSQAR